MQPHDLDATVDEAGFDWMVDQIRDLAQLLREAKKAHTEWENKFEGNVPAHDWEVWYAQYIELKLLNAASAAQWGSDDDGFPVMAPAPIAKLMTLVGPLE